MTCDEALALILWYPGPSLTPAERQAVVDHTMSCSSCRATLVATLAVATRMQMAAAALPVTASTPAFGPVGEPGPTPRPQAIRVAQAILDATLPPIAAVFAAVTAPPSRRMLRIRSLIRWGGVRIV